MYQTATATQTPDPQCQFAAVAQADVQVMSFETYATANGGSRQKLGEAALHMSSANKSERTHRRQVEAQARQDRALIALRAQLQLDYDDLLRAGRIRPPTAKEENIARCNGHPDNECVQASRRIAERRGWKWQQES